MWHLLAQTTGAAEASTIDAWLKILLGSGGAAAVMILVIKQLLKDRDKSDEKLEVERKARFDAILGQIDLIKESNKRCAEDRNVLHGEVRRLNNELTTVRALHIEMLQRFSDRQEAELANKKTSKIKLAES